MTTPICNYTRDGGLPISVHPIPLAGRKRPQATTGAFQASVSCKVTSSKPGSAEGCSPSQRIHTFLVYLGVFGKGPYNIRTSPDILGYSSAGWEDGYCHGRASCQRQGLLGQAQDFYTVRGN